MAKNTYNKSHP